MLSAVDGNIPVQRSILPPGEAGVDATVRKMTEMAHSIYGSKSPKIRALAIDLVKNAGVPQKDYYGEIVAVFDWVKNPNNIRYVRDPVGQETLSYPEEVVFNAKSGDCDDKTILMMAMLGALGIRTYPVVVGMAPGQYSHVYLHAIVPPGRHRNAGQIVPLDPIMSEWAAGREAKNIKSKKTYPALSLATGANMSGLEGYAVGPSYLDTEDSGAAQLLVPDKHRCYTHADHTVANATRAVQKVEGIDAMMGGGLAAELPPTGGYYTSTSAGDAGTVEVNAGQLVPRGFLRDEPDRQELMAMHPATSKELGPLGPIYQQTMRPVTGMLPHSKAPRVPSLQRQLATKQPAQPVLTVVGTKRYEVPTVSEALRSGKGLVAHPTTFLKKPKIVTLAAPAKVKLGQNAKPRTLGEELAFHEALAGELGAAVDKLKRAAPHQPAAKREKLGALVRTLTQRLDVVEKNLLALRQEARRVRGPAPKTNTVRAAAITAGASPTPMDVPVYGADELAGDPVKDYLTNPWFYGPIIGVLGIFAVIKLLKKRSPSAASA